MYFYTFQRIFTAWEKCGYRVYWAYLHQVGFKAVVMDMDTKQLPGNV